MKKQHLFTLDINLIKKLHKKVARGFRSQYVEEAISNRLKNAEEYDIWAVPKEEIYKMARVYALKEEDEVLHAVLTNRLEELK